MKIRNGFVSNSSSSSFVISLPRKPTNYKNISQYLFSDVNENKIISKSFYRDLNSNYENRFEEIRKIIGQLIYGHVRTEIDNIIEEKQNKIPYRSSRYHHIIYKHFRSFIPSINNYLKELKLKPVDFFNKTYPSSLTFDFIDKYNDLPTVATINLFDSHKYISYINFDNDTKDREIKTQLIKKITLFDTYNG